MVSSNRIGQVKPKLKKVILKLEEQICFNGKVLKKLRQQSEYINVVCISRTSCCHRQLVPEIQNIGKNKKNYLKKLFISS